MNYGDVGPYLRWLKTQRCAACQKHGTHANPIEAAHVRGIYSERLRDLSHRSHKGLQGWAALPLCRECHQTQHGTSERRFLDLYVPHAHAMITTNILNWFLGNANEEVLDDDE